MPSLKTLLLSTTLLYTLAAGTLDRDKITCPKNWFPNTWKETKCCYGHMMVEDTDASCCVNYIPPYDPEAIITTTTSAISSTTTSMDFQEYWSGADYCFSKVPFTASDYSARVSAASSNVVKASASATGMGTGTMTGPEGTEATATATGTAEAEASGVNSGTGAAAETSAPNAAMSVAGGKEMVVVGGAAVVVGFFML